MPKAAKLTGEYVAFCCALVIIYKIEAFCGDVFQEICRLDMDGEVSVEGGLYYGKWDYDMRPERQRQKYAW